MSTRKIWLSGLLIIVVLNTVASAATEEEVTNAQHDRDVAQARRDTTKANAEEAEARLGTFDSSSLPKGTGEASSLNIEAKILAYKAVSTIAATIASNLAELKPKPLAVIFYSERELNAVMQYRAFMRQADVFHTDVLDTATDKSGAPNLPRLKSDADCLSPGAKVAPGPNIVDDSGGGLPPLATLGAALQVISIFKTDKKITGADVEITEFGLVAEVANKLIQQNIQVIYPPSFLPGAFSAKFESPKPGVASQYETLNLDAQILETFIGLISERREKLKKASLTKGITADCKNLFSQDVAVLNKRETVAKAQASNIVQLLAALAKVDDKTGNSMIQTLIIAEALTSHYKKTPYILQLKPIAAGGATLTKRNIFTTNFYFSGGGIVSYFLIHGETNEILLAGTIPMYADFIKAGDLQGIR